MLDLIAQLVDQEKVLACCIDKTGLIRHANDAAFAISPLCTTMFLSKFLPEFFPSDDYQPDYARFASQQTLMDSQGRRLELFRFGDWFLCRLQPPIDWKTDPAPSGDGSNEVERIRRAAVDLLQNNSENEDRVYFLYEEIRDKLEDEWKNKNQAINACHLLNDSIYSGSLNARQVILSCNRIEISYLNNFSLYPPQRVDLSDALTKLVGEIKTEAPGLKMAVEAEIDPVVTFVSINRELLRWVLLEAARMAAVSAIQRGGTTVFGIVMTREKGWAVITLSENTYLLTDDAHIPQRLSREESMRFIHRVVTYYHGEVILGETSVGDEQMQIRFPLLPDQDKAAPTLLLRTKSDYHYQKRVMCSDILIYLENFSND